MTRKVIWLLFIIGLVIVPASAIPGVTWSLQNNTSLAVQRYGHAQWSDGDDTYVAGGRLTDTVYLNDVWKSSDNGATWTQVNASSGWDQRDFLFGVNHNGTFVIGSGTNATTNFNDVWKSTDKGITWIQVNASAPWTKRHAQAAIVANDRIIVLGGYNSIEGTLGDDYYSSDYGATWILVNSSPGWERQLPAVYYDQGNDRILFSGGQAVTLTNDYKNDVWTRTRTGTTWTQITSNTSFQKTYGAAFTQFDGKYWYIGGVDDAVASNTISYGVDPKNQTIWQTIPAMYPSGSIYYGVASSTSTGIVVVGGRNLTSNLNSSYSTSVTSNLYTDAWGDANFKNRAAIEFVTNNTANEQVKVVVPYNSSMLANQADFKMLNITGTNIPFWVENTTQTNLSYVTLWVNPPNNTGKIYLYFNNTTATSLSNSTATFPAFEHFDSSTTWTASGSPTLAYASSAVTISGGTIDYRGLICPSTFGVNTTLRALYKRTGTGTHYEYFGYDVNSVSVNGANEYYFVDSAGTNYVYTKSGGVGSLSASLGASDANNHYIDLIRFASNTTTKRDGLILNVKTTNISTTALNPFLSEYAGRLVVDWVAVINGTDSIFAYYNTPESYFLPPVAAYSGTPLYGLRPLEVQFTDTSTETPTSWYWEFGDGDTSNEQNPLHNYQDGGIYTINMQASNDGGSDWENKTDYVDVYWRWSTFDITNNKYFFKYIKNIFNYV